MAAGLDARRKKPACVNRQKQHGAVAEWNHVAASA
jgi:hypothetical protein